MCIRDRGRLEEKLNNIEKSNENNANKDVCPTITGTNDEAGYGWGSPIMALQRGQRKGICLSMRERGRCNKPGCSYDHSIKGETVCQMQDYLKYGFCSDWYECKCRHPYDENKFGPWDSSLAKYRELAEKGMTPDTANRGRR